MQEFLSLFIQFIGASWSMITVENYFLSLPFFFLVFQVLFGLVAGLFVSKRRTL